MCTVYTTHKCKFVYHTHTTVQCTRNMYVSCCKHSRSRANIFYRPMFCSDLPPKDTLSGPKKRVNYSILLPVHGEERKKEID